MKTTKFNRSFIKSVIAILATFGLSAVVLAAQCAAITKKGRRCKRPAASGSGFCYQHGGTSAPAAKPSNAAVKAGIAAASAIVNQDEVKTDEQGKGSDPRISTFCGYEFGSELDKLTDSEKNTPADKMIVRNSKLKKPFRKFKDVELYYNGEGHRLRKVCILQRIGKDDTAESIHEEIVNITEVLSEKYGIKFKQIDNQFYEFYERGLWIAVRSAKRTETLKRLKVAGGPKQVDYRVIEILVDRQDIENTKVQKKSTVNKSDLDAL